jgi:glycosyltransferase involved in cell wall biosynthesis
MIITQVISSIDKSKGGPSRSSVHLVESLASKECNVNLFATKTQFPLVSSFKNINAKLFLCKRNHFGFSKALNKKLDEDKSYILHGHGIWNLAVHQMAVIARRKSKPYIISPRGMLEPWSLSQSYLKKKIALLGYQKKDLHRADCIHATAKSEAQNIRSLGFTNPIAIIPNGINLLEFPQYKKTNKKNKILFLSRIDKKKGVENLIKAFIEISPVITKRWEIEIVGNGDPKYIKSLQKLIFKFNKNHQITISNYVFGKEKLKKYQSADIFVLPTYSENFGIVVAEALACSVPVICTKGAPWEELNTFNCGDWIDIGVDPLKKSLIKLMLKTKNDLNEMGKNGRKLIIKKYSISSVSKKFKQLYKWILKESDKPDFII